MALLLATGRGAVLSHHGPTVATMWQYRLFDLDPASDIDDALERYAKAGWHTWAAGRGAVVVVNGHGTVGT